MDRFVCGMVDDLPEGRPQEKPLTAKKKRQLSPVSKPSLNSLTLWSSLAANVHPPQEEPIALKKELTALKVEPTRLQEEPTRLQEEPTRLQEEHTALQEEPTRLQEQHTALQEEPTTLQEEHTALQEPETQVFFLEVSAPLPAIYQPSLAAIVHPPQEVPSTLKEELTALKEELIALKEELIALKVQPKAVQVEPTALQMQPTALQEEHITLQMDPTTLQEEHITLQEEPGIQVLWFEVSSPSPAISQSSLAAIVHPPQEEPTALKEQLTALKMEPNAVQTEHTALQEEHTTLQEERIALQEENIAVQEEHIALQEEPETQVLLSEVSTHLPAKYLDYGGNRASRHSVRNIKKSRKRKSQSSLAAIVQALKEELTAPKVEPNAVQEEPTALQEEPETQVLFSEVSKPAKYLNCDGSGTATPRTVKNTKRSRKRKFQCRTVTTRSAAKRSLFSCGMVDDLPKGRPQKKPLTVKKEKQLSTVPKPSPKPPSSSASSNNVEPPLRDAETSRFLHYGSEEDSEDDLDEDEVGPQNVREINRVARAHFGLDEEVDHVQNMDKFDFNWRAFPQPQISPELRREAFSDKDCGPTVPIATPYDAFTAIWDHDIMEHIAKETNAYAQQVAVVMLEDGAIRPSSRITRWIDTDVDELMVYFAIIMATGVVVKSRLEEYWNVAQDIFSTPGFSASMSINRYLLLSKCLHFQNNLVSDPEKITLPQAKLFKVQPILDHLNNKFSQLYNLSQNIALDESLTMWKGWLDINQFISNKTAEVGIKTYEVCESQTGYLWRFEVHAGHDEPQENSPISGIVPTLVLRLLNGLEYKGHTIWMDSFYNSPALARELKVRGFDCVGTLRTDRQLVPAELANLQKTDMAVGQVCGCTSGDVDLLVWRDRNRVAFVSTYHGLATTMCGDTRKPTVVADYNVCMGGVDRKDQMLSMYPIERRRNKIWYKKFFRRLLNASILNAYILYQHSHPQITHTHRSFRKALVKELLARHCKRVVPKPVLPASGNAGHFPAQYDILPESTRGEHMRRSCVVCKKRTSVYCIACAKPLCVFTCFQPYHS